MGDVIEALHEDEQQDLFMAMAASPWEPGQFSMRLKGIQDAVKHGGSMDRAAAKLAEMRDSG